MYRCRLLTGSAKAASCLASNPSSMDVLEIPDHSIIFDTPIAAFNISGGSSDLYLGHHTTAGRVAVKRIRPPGAVANGNNYDRVSQLEALRSGLE